MSLPNTSSASQVQLSFLSYCQESLKPEQVSSRNLQVIVQNVAWHAIFFGTLAIGIAAFIAVGCFAPLWALGVTAVAAGMAMRVAAYACFHLTQSTEQLEKEIFWFSSIQKIFNELRENQPSIAPLKEELKGYLKTDLAEELYPIAAHYAFWKNAYDEHQGTREKTKAEAEKPLKEHKEVSPEQLTATRKDTYSMKELVAQCRLHQAFALSMLQHPDAPIEKLSSLGKLNEEISPLGRLLAKKFHDDSFQDFFLFNDKALTPITIKQASKEDLPDLANRLTKAIPLKQ
jgi:hypothetical protein